MVYNDSTQGANYTNPQCVDTKVTLNTGCMQVVFLNKFVQDLLVRSDGDPTGDVSCSFFV